jgi:hypothetical protein
MLHSCNGVVCYNICRPPDLTGRYYIVTSPPSGSIPSVISSSQLSSCVQPAGDDNTVNKETFTFHYDMTGASKEQIGTSKTSEVCTFGC